MSSLQITGPGYSLSIPYAEFEASYVRSSGPGGQNVNKVNSKCVLHWNVRECSYLSIAIRARFLTRFSNRVNQDGYLVLSGDRYRDQKRNFEDCIEKLAEMIQEVVRPPKLRTQTRPTRSSERRRESDKKAHSQKKAHRKVNRSSED